MLTVAVVACFLALLRAHFWEVLFIGVSLIALLWTQAIIHGPRLLQHRDYCLRRVAKHQLAEEKHRSCSHREQSLEEASASLRRVAYHAAMRKKWARGASWPWEAVAPDPLEPE